MKFVNRIYKIKSKNAISLIYDAFAQDEISEHRAAAECGSPANQPLFSCQPENKRLKTAFYQPKAETLKLKVNSHIFKKKSSQKKTYFVVREFS